MANWKEAVNFQISEVPYILSYVFINIEFVTFCITLMFGALSIVF